MSGSVGVADSSEICRQQAEQLQSDIVKTNVSVNHHKV